MSKTVLKAKDFMTKDVIVVEENMKISKLNLLFREYNISGAPVLNKDDKLVGVITKTDVINAFIDTDLNLSVKISLKDILDSLEEHTNIELSSAADLVVKDIMTPNPVTIKESTPIGNVADEMIINNIHRLIVTKRGKIVGQISTFDLLFQVAKNNTTE